MTARKTPDRGGLAWATFDESSDSPVDSPAAEGLRERKKRLTRQHLSGTATAMFLDRGFDAVRVAEIAEACQVSEKTVYNYFPTKESLLLDREDAMVAALRAALAEPGRTPVQAMVGLLTREVDALTTWLKTQGERGPAIIRGFRQLIDSTPALRAHQHDSMNRLADVAAETLAQRVGLDAGDPEPQLAARALLGLLHVQFRGLREVDATFTPAQFRRHLTAQITRAARVLEGGLSAFDPPASGQPTPRASGSRGTSSTAPSSARAKRESSSKRESSWKRESSSVRQPA